MASARAPLPSPQLPSSRQHRTTGSGCGLRPAASVQISWGICRPPPLGRPPPPSPRIPPAPAAMDAQAASNWGVVAALAAPHALYAYIWFFSHQWRGAFKKRSVEAFETTAWALKGARGSSFQRVFSLHSDRRLLAKLPGGHGGSAPARRRATRLRLCCSRPPRPHRCPLACPRPSPRRHRPCSRPGAGRALLVPAAPAVGRGLGRRAAARLAGVGRARRLRAGAAAGGARWRHAGGTLAALGARHPFPCRSARST